MLSLASSTFVALTMVVKLSRRLALGLVVCGAGACSFSSDNDVGASDARPGQDATPVDDAPPGDGGTPRSSHLLLSEIKTKVNGEEFIEIYNATGADVDLEGYYLADTAEYARLPGKFGGGPAPDINEADFVVAFPAGASIARGEVAVVALDGTAFAEAFGFEPNFALKGNAAALTPPAYDDAIGPFVSLTDGGEAIALFYWDGDSDLVRDVDLVQSGDGATPVNVFGDKGEVQVDGPDTDNAASTYAADALTLGGTPGTTVDAQSYERAAVETDHELHAGNGNGLDGHDETSEDLQATWSLTDTPNPGTAPKLR